MSHHCALLSEAACLDKLVIQVQEEPVYSPCLSTAVTKVYAGERRMCEVLAVLDDSDVGKTDVV